MIKVGMTIEDRYEIVEKIGTGGMSEVFKARDHKLNRFVAVKAMKPEFCEDKKFVANFKVEAQSAAALIHPNIVNVYDVNETDGTYYIVMEYVDGITLKKYIKVNGKLPVKEATGIAIQVVQGMEAAHNAGIVHRDIKPQNILISREGKIKVTDFGIARTTTANTLSSDVLGSAQYISPEQARSDVVDARSDIYSFGIVLFEMLTGKLPFEGDSPVNIALMHIQDQVPPVDSVVSDMPLSIVKIVEKCTQKKPENRYQKASSLLADLKTSLVNPNGDFVVIDTEDDDGATVILSRTDAQRLKAEGMAAEEGESAAAVVPEDSGGSVSYYTDEESEDDYDVYGYENDEESDGSNRKFDKILTICGIVAGVIIVIVLILVLFTSVFGNGGCSGSSCGGTKQPETEESTDDSEETSSETTTPEEITMPNVVGMNVERATAQLEKLGLVVEVKSEDSDEEEGYVLEQSIEEGETVTEGKKVTLTVSSGKKMVELMDVTGLSESEALGILSEQGVEVSVNMEYSDYYDVGYVTQMVPDAGEEVEEGSTVYLTVSRGPEPTTEPPTETTVATISVPNCYGFTEVDATEKCEGEGLRVRIIYTSTEDEDMNGKVVSQDPGAWYEVDPNTTVTLYVGQYTEPTTEEPTTEEPTTEEPTTEPTTAEPTTEPTTAEPAADDGGNSAEEES